MPVNCERCGNRTDPGPHCSQCAPIVERESLRAWASQWAASLVDEDMQDHFFTVLAAAWEQGFIQARKFEDARPTRSIEDNPFTPGGQA